MTAYRVLIVDDEIETRSVLRASVKAIEEDIEVIDVPSGEEAFFEYSLEPFDLLIADVRLAGMTGLELMWALKGVAPGLRVILVTGVRDPKVRQKVMNAGADYYFIKPIEIADFVDAVTKCLKATNKESLANENEQIYAHHNLSEQMINLRVDLGATVAMLLNDKGEILAQTDDLPNSTNQPKLISSLMTIFSAGVKVSQFLGAKSPNNIYYSSGEKEDLFLSQIGNNHALLIVVDHHEGEKYLGKVIDSIRKMIPIISDSLAVPDIKRSRENAVVESQSELMREIDEDIDEVFDPELGKLLKSKETDHLKDDEIEAFWTSVTSEKTDTAITNPDSISYEQARKLGLTPGDEK